MQGGGEGGPYKSYCLGGGRIVVRLHSTENKLKYQNCKFNSLGFVQIELCSLHKAS